MTIPHCRCHTGNYRFQLELDTLLQASPGVTVLNFNERFLITLETTRKGLSYNIFLSNENLVSVRLSDFVSRRTLYVRTKKNGPCN